LNRNPPPRDPSSGGGAKEQAMVSTEPELDAEGRPRHDDPRDHSRPIAPERKKAWLPWLLAAVAIVIGLVMVMGP
jgi:hypothetical protein